MNSSYEPKFVIAISDFVIQALIGELDVDLWTVATGHAGVPMLAVWEILWVPCCRQAIVPSPYNSSTIELNKKKKSSVKKLYNRGAAK